LISRRLREFGEKISHDGPEYELTQSRKDAEAQRLAKPARDIKEAATGRADVGKNRIISDYVAFWDMARREKAGENDGGDEKENEDEDDRNSVIQRKWLISRIPMGNFGRGTRV
jgi:hypothetical protein